MTISVHSDQNFKVIYTTLYHRTLPTVKTENKTKQRKQNQNKEPKQQQQQKQNSVMCHPTLRIMMYFHSTCLLERFIVGCVTACENILSM